MLAVLSHQLESFQDTHTHGLPKGQVCSGQKKAGPVGGGGTSLVYVCSTTSFAQEMLLEGTGKQAVLDLSLANYVLICQDSNNSIQLSGH